MIVVNIHTGNNISAMNSGQGTLDMWKAQTDSPVLRVSELSAIIKELFLDQRLQDVLVEGEVTNYKHHSRGNRYFSLSEEDGKESAVIKCMMWSSDAGKLPFVPEDGMRVIARGRIDFYPPGATCQLYVKSMRLAGAGEKYLLVERWKQELSLEGCFAPERKQPLPLYPYGNRRGDFRDRGGFTGYKKCNQPPLPAQDNSVSHRGAGRWCAPRDCSGDQEDRWDGGRYNCRPGGWKF